MSLELVTESPTYSTRQNSMIPSHHKTSEYSEDFEGDGLLGG
jgi:hypothetical protein